MDGTRARRTKDEKRRSWYAKWRAMRFAARFFGIQYKELNRA